MMPNPLRILLVKFCLLAVWAPHACAGTAAFQAAQDAYSQQDWPAALEMFLRAAEQAGDLTERAMAHFYAAECALQLKNYGEAQRLYQQVLDADEAVDIHAQARFRVAESTRLLGDLPAALAAFQRFVEDCPRDELSSEARNNVAEILLEMRRYDSAVQEFVYVIEHGDASQNDRARLGMARGLLALGRSEEVPIALGRLCQSKNASIATEALLLLGRAKYEAGQFDQALATFRRVYSLDGGSEATCRARLAAGWALWKLSRLDQVVTEVQPLRTNRKLAGDYHYLLGMAAYTAKNWTEAGRQLQSAVEEGGVSRAAALYYAGETALLSGNPQSAKAAYRRLLESDPTSEWADDAMWGLVKVARTVGVADEFEQACDDLRLNYPKSEYIGQLPLVAAEPVNPLRLHDKRIAVFEEAVGLERDGRFGGAIAAYQEFLAQSEAGALRAEALWRAARLQERLKQYAESQQLYTQLLAEFPDFERASEALANVAKLEAELGNNDKAAKYCRELLEKFPQSLQAVEASYWLAVAAADEERNDEAQWQVDWLLDRLNPANRSLSDFEKRVFGQTLCLECQLLAADGEWQEVARLLEGSSGWGPVDTISARLAFWQAEAALRLGNHAEARSRFDELVEQTIGVNESWVPMVTLRRAQLAARREDWSEVLKLVDQLDDRYPEFELAYECDYLRGRACAGRGEMSAARTAYDHVLENDWAAGTETSAMAQWMIGESYFHQRNYELAQVAYERVIERHHFPEWQARAALQAGKCAELVDNWESATKYYADAAARWSDTKSAHELSARLRWVQEQVAQKQAALRR